MSGLLELKIGGIVPHLGSDSQDTPHSIMPKEKVAVLLIDPQIDFHPGGSLAVAGANNDSERIARLINIKASDIDEIFVTLDSHHRGHIAHGIFWINEVGEHPNPFTLISHNDVVNGVWRPTDPKHLDHCKYYTKELERKGRFTLCIWPEHCLIGTPGHAVVPVINTAIQDWAKNKMKTITYHSKGMNCFTEMYSALVAEVEMPDDPTTSLDQKFLSMLLSADKIIVGGQAMSHCVYFTVRDLFSHWKKDPARFILLTDGCSPVSGFEQVATNFVREMEVAGVTVVTTEQAIEILGNQVENKNKNNS